MTKTEMYFEMHEGKNEGIMRALFDSFHKEEVGYCVFKSTLNLRMSFCALSDFDILVAPKDYDLVHDIFARLSIKQFETPYLNNYSGVENWLAFDNVDGSIYHLHLHFNLLTGTSHVKEYRIFWDDKLLENAALNKAYNVMIPKPEWELLLLITRIVLKGGLEDFLRAQKNKYVLKSEYVSEMQYLLGLSNKEQFVRLAHDVYSQETVASLENVINDNSISSSVFIKLYYSFMKEYSCYKSNGQIKSCIKSHNQELITKFAALNKEYGGFYVSKKRREKGLIIAFVGVDGSGKSKLTEDVFKWLSYKIETQKLYMGSGDGSRSALKKLRSYNKDFIRNLQYENNSFIRMTGETISQFFDAGLSLEVARENHWKIVKMDAYRRNGGICVLDRFPQLEYEGYNDGPKISNGRYGTNASIWNCLRKKEHEYLDIVKEIKPDIIFRLNISEETCVDRKPEHRRIRKELQRKLETLKSLRFEGANIIDIDGEKPYPEELLIIKRIIWDYL